MIGFRDLLKVHSHSGGAYCTHVVPAVFDRDARVKVAAVGDQVHASGG